MFKWVRNSFTLPFFLGILTMGAAPPAFAAEEEYISGKVSSVDENTGTLTIVKNIIQVDAGDAQIIKKGVKTATLADISKGDIIKIHGNTDASGTIQATNMKVPVKLKGYDCLITGITEEVNTSAKTFIIFGQKIKTDRLSGVTMSGMTLSFNTMRSGVSVDVYIKRKGRSLLARKMVIRTESCTHCHEKIE